MTIYEITAEMQEIETILEESGGELTPELEERMTLNEENLTAKIDQYNALYRKFKATVATLDEEIKRLTALKKTATNSAKAITDRILFAMQAIGKSKIDGDTCKAYIRTTKAIQCDEERLIDPYMYVIYQARQAMPAFISLETKVSKAALKDLETLPDGAEQVENVSLMLK